MRDDAFVRKFRMFLRLLDGKSRTILDFEDIRIDENVTKKTLLRDLNSLARIKELSICIYSQNRIYYYKSSYKLSNKKQFNKACKKCKEIKPLTRDYFYYGRYGIGGFDDWCISCVRKRSLNWAKNNGAKKRMYQRRWYKRNKERLNLRRREKYAEII